MVVTVFEPNQNGSGENKENIPPYLDFLPEPPLLANRYEPLALLGEGTFGQVIKYLDHQSQSVVAVKRLKGEDSLLDGTHEYSILLELQRVDPDKANLIRFIQAFQQNQQVYLIFEYFEKDLEKYIDFSLFSLSVVRVIATQLLVALQALQGLQIIHTDIKPSNMMVVGVFGSALHIKLIDFGSAIFSYGRRTIKDCITTLNYRSPEVILGVPSDETIDMWSVGCVLAELFIGEALYQASDESQMLQCFVRSHEKSFPVMFMEGIHFNKFLEPFDKGFIFKDQFASKCCLASLKDLEEFNEDEFLEGNDKIADRLDHETFVHFIQKLLEMDPNLHLSPEEALSHDFVTLRHVGEYSQCQHVRDCTKSMNDMVWMH